MQLLRCVWMYQKRDVPFIEYFDICLLLKSGVGKVVGMGGSRWAIKVGVGR